jgi:cytochrome c oxidase subunit 2
MATSNQAQSATHSAAIAVSHALERRWGLAMAAIMLVLFAVIIYTALHYRSHPPSRVEPIDSARLQLEGEFVEANLGARVEPDGSVTVRLVAQQYAWVPNCILVPADTPVRIRAASGDVIHGLLVLGTNVNTMVVPGYVATVTTQFPRSGEHLMPCHEFCGAGHQAMWAQVRVVERNDFPFAQARNRSVSCAR